MPAFRDFCADQRFTSSEMRPNCSRDAAPEMTASGRHSLRTVSSAIKCEQCDESVSHTRIPLPDHGRKLIGDSGVGDLATKQQLTGAVDAIDPHAGIGAEHRDVALADL